MGDPSAEAGRGGFLDRRQGSHRDLEKQLPDPNAFTVVRQPRHHIAAEDGQDKLFTVVAKPVTADDLPVVDHDPVVQLRGRRKRTRGAQEADRGRDNAEVDIDQFKNLRTVELFRGNLVLDCPVPSSLLDDIPHAQAPERDEFTHTRYTAVTDAPRDFSSQGYLLRQALFAKPRNTKILVGITMYNENDVLLGKTLHAVMNNVRHLTRTWGEDAWRNIVVCVIADGRAKINHRSSALLAALGVYQVEAQKASVHGKDVVVHLWEYTTRCSVDIRDNRVRVRPQRQRPPCQILFCLKEKNQKKVNSHRWLFEAFAKSLLPSVCITLDAGTKPAKDAFFHLWSAFERDEDCACAIGENKIRTYGRFLNPLTASQEFEYKSKGMLDRPLESLFGHRLDSSGPFSAYRYRSLLNFNEAGPLDKYLGTDISDTAQSTNFGIMNTNMALAEDRILAFELVNNPNRASRLCYVSSAIAEVDVPETIEEFILFRRRLLNGNAFASVYEILKFFRILRTSHSAFRKCLRLAQLAYQATSMVLSWFSIGLLYLTFYIITLSTGDEALYGRAGFVVARLFGTAYVLNLILSFIISLGNSPYKSRHTYNSISCIWIILMIYFCFALIALIVHIGRIHAVTVADLFETPLFWSIVTPILGTYSIRLLVSLMFFSPWHMFTWIIPYVLLTTTRVNLVSVYAFCNIHDVSSRLFGSPPKLPSVQLANPGVATFEYTPERLNEQYKSQLALLITPVEPYYVKMKGEEDYFSMVRTLIVSAWVTSNIILVSIITNVPSTNIIRFGPEIHQTQGSVVFLAFVFWRFAADSLFKALGVPIYLISNWVQKHSNKSAYPV